MTLSLIAGSCSIGSHGGKSTLFELVRSPPSCLPRVFLEQLQALPEERLPELFQSRCGGEPPALVRNMLLQALRMDAEDLRQIPLTDRREHWLALGAGASATACRCISMLCER